MDYSGFYDWLISDKKMSVRSAKDVLSRCKRICIFLSIDKFGDNTVEELNSNESFQKQSMFIKSQLRRAVSLWCEYGGKDE